MRYDYRIERINGELTWIYEGPDIVNEVPAPRTGGTWRYCPFSISIRGGAETCAGGPPSGWGPKRFRTLKAYRRHWRKWHGQ